MDPRLPRLAVLADLVEGRETARLARVVAEARGIEAQIEALRGNVAPAAPEGFTLGGHDALWDRWRMGEIARLNRALADLRLQLDEARRAAALATARSQVLSRLAGRDRS